PPAPALPPVLGESEARAPAAATAEASARASSRSVRAAVAAPSVEAAAFEAAAIAPIASKRDVRALLEAVAAEHARITALHDEHVRTQTELHERFLAARASALATLSAMLRKRPGEGAAPDAHSNAPARAGE